MTPKKREESNKWAEKEKGLKPLKNLLHPRVKGFMATINSLRTEMDCIYDLTFSGDVPSMGKVLMGVANTTIHIHVRRFDISRVPQSDKEMENWCRDLWYSKDDLLEQFKKNNTFPGKYDNPFKVNHLELHKLKSK